MRPVDIAVSADYAFSRLVIIMISREQIYYWNFCHSICVFGLDMEGIGGSEAIDGLKSSMALRQKEKKQAFFGFILESLLPL